MRYGARRALVEAEAEVEVEVCGMDFRLVSIDHVRIGVWASLGIGLVSAQHRDE